MKRTLAAEIASLVQARANCQTSGNQEWFERHSAKLQKLVSTLMPSGGGIDTGTHIALDKCSGSQIVFTFGFHHMDEYGGYDGWTDHTAIIKPSFDGVAVKITGVNRNGIKEYLAEVYGECLEDARLKWEV